MNIVVMLSSLQAPPTVRKVVRDFQSVTSAALSVSTVEADLETACKQLNRVEQQIEHCTSDFAYWSLQSEKCYWKAIRDILKAATIVGPKCLPEIELPDLEGLVTMDVICKVESYGFRVLRAAEAKGVMS